MDNAKKQSTTRRTLHYFWAATKRHLGLFVALVVSTVFFSGLLTYGSPFVMSLIVDRISASPVTAPSPLSASTASSFSVSATRKIIYASPSF